MSLTPFLLYFVLGVVVYYFLKRKSRGKNYPPGPIGLPIIGHKHLLGGTPHKKCIEWAKEFGPIFSIDYGALPTIVLSDPKLIRAAFNDNGCSGRPDFPSFNARSEEPEGVIFTEGQKWLDQRRFILRTLRDFGFGRNSMEGILHEEVKDLLEGFRVDAGKPQSTNNRFNIAVVNALWALMAGERFKHDDPDLHRAIRHTTSTAQDNNILDSWVNFFPALAKYAPHSISGIDKYMKDTFPVIDFLKKPIEEHKTTFQDGHPRDFIDAYIVEMNRTTNPSSSFYNSNGEKSILFSVLDLFLAGAETTSTTLTWTCLYLAKFPEVQLKLQEEIEKVVGNSRLPSMTDRVNMPYTEAVIHEVMRYSTLVPMGVMHRTMKEVELGGYTIPADTMILANQYAVHYDKSVWGDPENFRPERFLNKDGAFVKHESFIAFSVGKRVCLGETLARDELFMFTTSLFQAFNISPVTSTDDLTVEPLVGSVLSPRPQKLIITERN